MVIENNISVYTEEDKKSIQWKECSKLNDKKTRLLLEGLYIFSRAMIFWGFTYIFLVLSEWKLERNLGAIPISIAVGLVPIVFYKITLRFYDSSDNNDIIYGSFKVIEKLPIEEKHYYPILAEDIQSKYRTKIYVRKSRYDSLCDGKEFKAYLDKPEWYNGRS